MEVADDRTNLTDTAQLIVRTTRTYVTVIMTTTSRSLSRYVSSAMPLQRDRHDADCTSHLHTEHFDRVQYMSIREIIVLKPIQAVKNCNYSESCNAINSVHVDMGCRHGNGWVNVSCVAVGQRRRYYSAL